jgi:hypothetical protein
LRKIKEQVFAPHSVASPTPIAESAFPKRTELLLSRIFARTQTAATPLRVDVRPAAEFKSNQAPNPAGVVRSGGSAIPDSMPQQ